MDTEVKIPPIDETHRHLDCPYAEFEDTGLGVLGSAVLAGIFTDPSLAGPFEYPRDLKIGLVVPSVRLLLP